MGVKRGSVQIRYTPRMNVSWLEWFGYLASVVVLVSLAMRSIAKLRWINLAGSLLFAAYGFLIGSIPTGALNIGIAGINAYFLFKIYSTGEELVLIEANLASPYFRHFWNTNRGEILRLFGDVPLSSDKRAFYFLRNNITAGILVGHEMDDTDFCIDIDFVTREYRDFKLGRYFIAGGRLATVMPRMHRLRARPSSAIHRRYLKKLGFVEADQRTGLLERELTRDTASADHILEITYP